MFSHGHLLFWKNWGEITELFYYNLSDSQQIMALRSPLFFLPLASNITINGYSPEYHDDRWSEVLVSKNVLLFCSGNSLQVSTTLPPCTCGQTASGALQGTVVCVIFVLSVSAFPHQGLSAVSLAPPS